MRPLPALIVCLVCAAAANASFAGNDGGRLEVRGKELLFNGKPIRLRGVSVGDTIRDRELRFGSDFEAIARDWKANVVRMGVHPRYWKTLSHEKVLDRIAEDVDAALKNGLFVMISYMVIGWPDGTYEMGTGGGPKDLNDSDFKLAMSFWDAAARRWGKNGRIMFELWNEAIYTQEDWRPEVGQKWSKLKPFHAKLLQIVRKHSDNVVIVSSNHWSYLLTGVRNDLLEGKNIAYSWHIYAGQYKNDMRKWAAALDDLQEAAPVIVTEWGFDPNTTRHYQGTAEDFGKPFVRDFLEGKGLHSVAWCWHTTVGPPMLKEDWLTPTEYGAFVRDYLRANNK